MKDSDKKQSDAKSLKIEIRDKIIAAINSAGGAGTKLIEKKIEKASKKLASKLVKASRKLQDKSALTVKKAEKSSVKGLKVAARKLDEDSKSPLARGRKKNIKLIQDLNVKAGKSGKAPLINSALAGSSFDIRAGQEKPPRIRRTAAQISQAAAGATAVKRTRSVKSKPASETSAPAIKRTRTRKVSPGTSGGQGFNGHSNGVSKNETAAATDDEAKTVS